MSPNIDRGQHAVQTSRSVDMCRPPVQTTPERSDGTHAELRIGPKADLSDILDMLNGAYGFCVLSTDKP
jgi:hypothetical protein